MLVYLACVLQYVQITYMDNDVFVDSLGFSLYVIIYSVYLLFSVNEESLISSLPTVLCFHFFLLLFICESFQSNVEEK